MEKPIAYISIPQTVAPAIAKWYINFINDIGFTAKVWNRSSPYNRRIMDEASIHFIIYDLNSKSGAENGYISRGCYEEAEYASQGLEIPSYIMYVPYTVPEGIKFYNYVFSSSRSDQKSYINFRKLGLKSPVQIDKMILDVYSKTYTPISSKPALFNRLVNAYERFILGLYGAVKDYTGNDRLKVYNLPINILARTWARNVSFVNETLAPLGEEICGMDNYPEAKFLSKDKFVNQYPQTFEDCFESVGKKIKGKEYRSENTFENQNLGLFKRIRNLI